MLAGIKPGTKFRSAVCDTEVIVIKTPAAELDLRCGGEPMVGANEDKPAGVQARPGFDSATQVGKRYVDDSGDLEILCTKGGACSLSVGDTLLTIKEAKPLPSSD